MKLFVNNSLNDVIFVDDEEIVNEFMNSEYYELFNARRYLHVFIVEKYKATYSGDEFDLLLETYSRLKKEEGQNNDYINSYN